MSLPPPVSVCASGGNQCTLWCTSIGRVSFSNAVAISPSAAFKNPVPNAFVAVPPACRHIRISWYTLKLMLSRCRGVVPCVVVNALPSGGGSLGKSIHYSLSYLFIVSSTSLPSSYSVSRYLICFLTVIVASIVQCLSVHISRQISSLVFVCPYWPPNQCILVYIDSLCVSPGIVLVHLAYPAFQSSWTQCPI